MPIDYSRYPLDWKTEIVPRILTRADHKCEFCGLENKQEVYSVGIQLLWDGKYKIKRIWISNESDKIRIEKFRHWENPKVVKVVLTIAHLDHDEENHNVSDDRLAALCQYCHLNYDAKEKMRRIMSKAVEKQEVLI